MEEPQISFCTNGDGIRVAYAMLGQGPALVCALDFGLSIKDIRHIPQLMSSLEKGSRYHTMVVYDHSGTGLSGRNRTDFSLDSSVRDMKAVIEHLKLDRVMLFGMCGGGPVAAACAASLPERVSHLVLFNTSASYGLIAAEDVRSSMVSLYKNRFNFAVRGALNLMYPGTSTALTESLIRMLASNVTPDTYAQYWEKFSRFDVLHMLPDIKALALVLHRKDYFIPVQSGADLAALIPGARFVQLEVDEPAALPGDYTQWERASLEFLGDRVPDVQGKDAMQHTAVERPGKLILVKSTADTGEEAESSNPNVFKLNKKKKEWLHLGNPLVYILVTVIASVIAGIILSLIKC